MFKKFATVLAALALAAATFGFSSGTAYAKSSEANQSTESSIAAQVTLGQPDYTSIGRDGVSAAKSPYTGELDISHAKIMKGENVHKMSGIRFVEPLLNYQVDNVTNATLGRTYIYFDLNNAEQMAWNSGNLAIYAYNSSSNTWTKLPTIYVNRGAYGRLSAIATGFGYYGLGETISTSGQ